MLATSSPISASVPSAHDFPAASKAFFAALGDCVVPGAHPHPVTARNLALVPAWQNWTAAREGVVNGQSAADKLVADPSRRFDECAKLIEKAISTDPVWHNLAANASPFCPPEMGVDFVTASLMFWRRKHALIELTPTLQQLLARSDLGDDIPVELLKPPMPACYIRFGDEMQQSALLPQQGGHAFTRIDGVYVFETMRAGERFLALLAIYEVGDHPGLGISGITIDIANEKEPLVQAIGRISAKESLAHREHHQALAQVCTKIFLYWNVESARRVMETPYGDAMRQLKGLGPKKSAKLRRRIDQLYDRVLLGPIALPAQSHGTHGDMAPHWRRGHFRMQPHGPHQSLRKVIFIAPTLVRADRLDDEHGAVHGMTKVPPI